MIRLRRLEREDAARLCVLWTGKQQLPGYHLPADEGEMTDLIDEWNGGSVQGACFEMLLIEENGAPVGLVSLFERGRSVSFGISVHPSVQKRGIGTAATQMVVGHCAGRWESLISECRADHAASIGLHEKCGFRRTGEKINGKGNRVILWEMPLEE